ncbi:MAG: GFA family protein [Pseudomonadota bacterium]
MTTFRGQCHCGAVRFSYPMTPEYLTQCNCSLCRRLGALWAYEQRQNVRLEHAAGATTIYIQGDKTLEAHSCRTCGCTTHWLSVDGDETSRMAVNFRLCDPGETDNIRVRQFDGADTWAYLD